VSSTRRKFSSGFELELQIPMEESKEGKVGENGKGQGVKRDLAHPGKWRLFTSVADRSTFPVSELCKKGRRHIPIFMHCGCERASHVRSSDASKRLNSAAKLQLNACLMEGLCWVVCAVDWFGELFHDGN
jgi:hypothetical protein